ncbi:hypothetical protein PPACK8108_LOCUS11728 [Phakopsora pachyrhizi]|uniref:Uncharacterized protein n=1 Tax=Phakopsora pachyrhizi TaxID=170000 RepID=A0AAV0B2J5_PHAPC|nr:hypothetical protein PPACK8108_LOCUS11728 [Phakopsora pachyrhizi]
MVPKSNTGALMNDSTSFAPTSTSNPNEETRSKDFLNRAIGNMADSSKDIPGSSFVPTGCYTAGSGG